MSMFAQPAPSSEVKIADYVGHLLLFYPREIRTGIVTTNGVADALVADVVILTHPDGPQAEPNVLVFQKVLQGSLKNNIGKDPVLARLARGAAKAGQSAPYILNPFNEADGAYATQYLHSVGGNPFQAASAPQFATPQPAAPAPAPLPTPAAAPVAVPVPAPIAPPAPAPAAAATQNITPEMIAAIQALGMQVPPVAAPTG